jgi:hypothetical protein
LIIIDFQKDKQLPASGKQKFKPDERPRDGNFSRGATFDGSRVASALVITHIFLEIIKSQLGSSLFSVE